MELDHIGKLAADSGKKIVFLVIDGLGGLPRERGGLTELETASTPNLDALAGEGICGLHQPVGAGITPGSGPGHLSVFGYDPVKYSVGRGVLAALGVGFDLGYDDVAARGNFCTVEQGLVTDRRAGRISTERNRELCSLLREIRPADAELFVEPVKEHRMLIVLRGKGLSGDLADTDPQHVGKAPLKPRALSADAERTAKIVGEFLRQAESVLADRHPANMVLTRGFAKRPKWPSMREAYGVKAAAIAAYPMYRGLARLIGMTILETGETVSDEIDTLERNWGSYDYFYLHVKKSDSAGEDGDFDRKVHVLEETDKLVPRIMALKPDVVVVTGDHSTPAALKGHSWHPVPALLWSEVCRSDAVDKFGERACMAGGLGPAFPATDLMPLALANALRLDKYGA